MRGSPEGGPFTEAGAKTWHIVPGTTPKVGEGTAKVFTYTIEVEDGIDTTTFGGDEGFARMVIETLANPKSKAFSRSASERARESDVHIKRIRAMLRSSDKATSERSPR